MARIPVALAGAMLLAAGTRAETSLDSWLAQDTATGDWGRLRSRAEAAGLTVDGYYQTDLLANPVGGERQGFAYAGLAEVALDFDLGQIAGLEGTSFSIAGYWTSGDDLSDTRIGNLIGVAQAFNGRTVGLGRMYLEQELFEGKLDIAIGRLSAGDDFATSDLYVSYVSAGINSNPFAIAENVPSFTADPVAQWGARAIVQPIEQIHVAAGIYNADPDVTKDGRHGVDFALDPDDGVLAIAEAGYRWNQAADAAGLPGSVTFGGYFDSSDFDFLDESGRSREGNYGFYLIARPDGVPRGRARQRPGPHPLGRAHLGARPADQYDPVFRGRWPGLSRSDFRPRRRPHGARRVLRQVQRQAAGPERRDRDRGQLPPSTGAVALPHAGFPVRHPAQRPERH
jgi:carbohydrate-selective porin OprB